jgi:hypothetical protein
MPLFVVITTISAGVVIGVLAAFGLTRFIEHILFVVTPSDPLTFVLIVILLAW